MRIDDTDPDELDDGERSRSRRTWVVLGVSLAVTAATIATLVVIRNNDDGTAAATTTEMAGPDTLVSDTQPVVPIAEPGMDSFPDYGSDYMGAELETMFQRVTDTGIRVTLQNSGNWDEFARGGDVPAVTVQGVAGVKIAPPDTVPPFPPGNGGWVPPAWCSPVGGFRLAMSYKDAIGISNGSRYSEVREGGLGVTLFSSGYAEGSPFRVLVLQVGPDIVQVGATWADGGGDAAVAVNGFVVLATPGASSTHFDVTLQTESDERIVPWAEMPREGDVAWQKSCSPPPPELPAAGEQPADAAAAEQQIRDNFALLWDSDVTFEERGAQLLDDTTGVQDAIDAVVDGGFADVAATAQHTITEVVFTSPTEAWFGYDIDTTISDFTGRFGIAYFIDGRWRFARAVICQDLSLAGGQCVPFADQIYPPGSDGAGGGSSGGPMPFPND